MYHVPWFLCICTMYHGRWLMPVTINYLPSDRAVSTHYLLRVPGRFLRTGGWCCHGLTTIPSYSKCLAIWKHLRRKLLRKPSTNHHYGADMWTTHLWHGHMDEQNSSPSTTTWTTSGTPSSSPWRRRRMDPYHSLMCWWPETATIWLHQYTGRNPHWPLSPLWFLWPSQSQDGHY